jgi:hypothetical protein
MRYFRLFVGFLFFVLAMSGSAAWPNSPDCPVSLPLRNNPHAIAKPPTKAWLEITPLIAEETDDSLDKNFTEQNRYRTAFTVEHLPSANSALLINLSPLQATTAVRLPPPILTPVLNI